MDLVALRPLLDQQSGIVSRRQLRELGATQNDLRRWLRGRELVEVHKGVYVNHTGPLTWSSRAWAAVQRYWPAALAHESAVRLAGDVVHVAISHDRRAPAPERRVQVHRLEDFDSRVRLDRSPPVQRYEDAVLWHASTLTRPAALEVISEACRSRRTTPLRLREELAGQPTLRQRGFIAGVLDDATDGVQSVLESAFLRRVERAHHLPVGERQFGEVTRQGRVYRDVRYRAYRVVVELDGRLGHEAPSDRAADMTRDLLAAATGDLLTIRLGWHHSEVEPCATAAALGLVLRHRGWADRPTGRRRAGRRARWATRVRSTSESSDDSELLLTGGPALRQRAALRHTQGNRPVSAGGGPGVRRARPARRGGSRTARP